jgi:hypothetical protein
VVGRAGAHIPDLKTNVRPRRSSRCWVCYEQIESEVSVGHLSGAVHQVVICTDLECWGGN